MAAAESEGSARRVVEVRSYNLKPGTRPRFHELVLEVVPMLERAGIAVVAHGPSPHDGVSYFLIRAFDGMDERQRKEDAFYGSAAWREGPRERVLALIESYTTIVLALDSATVEGLRSVNQVSES